MQRALSISAACAAALLATTGGGCNLGDGLDVGPGDDATKDVTGIDEGDAPERDAETEPDLGSGSATLLFSEAGISTERLCDVDGDGLGDNAVADLGTPASELFAAAASALVQGGTASGFRTAAHFPRVADLSFVAEQETLFFVFGAIDADFPKDPADDFSGDEQIYAYVRHLGPCGEPALAPQTLSISAGAFSSEPGLFEWPEGDATLRFHEARFSGSIAPGPASAVLDVCGYLAIAEIGGICLTGEVCQPDDVTLLEVFIGGGAAIGVPSLPGLSPDVDADGDGIERIMTDEDGDVASCIDGDGSVIEGRECWRDERIADGISVVLHAELVGAQLVGRSPGWEHQVEALLCAEFPPEESALEIGDGEGGCVGLEERCDPRLATPCCEPTHRCVGLVGREYLCLLPCEPAPCAYGHRVGRCERNGRCYAIGGGMREAGCEVDEVGCTTDYGASEDTLCVPAGYGSGTRCVEACEPRPSEDDCNDAALRCLPLVFEDGGYCSLVGG